MTLKHGVLYPDQSESVHNTYLIEQDAQNVSIESVDMNYDSEQIDQNDEDVDLANEHSDYAGANLNRKSTIGCCQFFGRRLISWQCKKQAIVATSTT
nr:uncharacterized mitochondrial protein AtMg00810-like [Tanacetum cinerariifolium]